MTVLYNSYPYWRYTPSKQGESRGLFVGNPLPLMVTHPRIVPSSVPCTNAFDTIVDFDNGMSPHLH